MKNKKFIFVSLLTIMLVGAFLRLLNFPNIPFGLNQDEMNAGYEAWSLLHFGTDRWGEQWPVYFRSWGSGQNVFFSYYLIPFVAFFGPTDFTVRLGMVIVGILLPLVVFFLTKKWFDIRTALLASALTAVFPELVRGSRWAVESNFVPFMVGVSLLVFSSVLLAEKPKKHWIILSLLPLAFLPYTYLITIVPVTIMLFVTVIWKKDIFRKNLKSWVAAFCIFIVVLIPLGLFILKTAFLNNMPFFFEKYLPFSIPAMEESRLSQISEERSGILETITRNFNNLFLGNYQSQIGGGDGVSHIPMFIVIGVIVLSLIPKIRKDFPFTIIHLWVLSALPLIFVVPLTNVRGNLFYVPSIILASALGVFVYEKANSKIIKATLVLLGVGYLAYVSAWFYSYQTKPMDFFYKDLKETVQHVEEINTEKLPVLLNQKDSKIEIPFTQLMWFLLMTPEEVATNDDPKHHLRNYYFGIEYLPSSGTYYDVVQEGYTGGCMDNPGSGKKVYTGAAWDVYKCDVR